MEVGGSHLIAMEAEQLKDMLARVRTRRTKGVLLVQELKKRESKLRSQLAATSVSLASYLDQLQKVVDCVRVSEAQEIGEGLAKVVAWQRKMQEGLVEMLSGWEIKDVVLDNFVDERGKKSKLMRCLRKRNKQEEEEKEEVMLRVSIKRALEEERLYYQAILLGLKGLVKGGSSLLGLGSAEAGKALEKDTQAKVAPSESLPTMRRTSLSSMASFSYSPGPEKASDSDDSGILSQGHEPVADVWQSSTRAQSGPIKSTPGDYEVRYSTVRRSPSPCFSPLRSPSPSLQNVQPPKIMDASTTLGCDKMRSQRPSRPPTQRCGRSPSQAGPWGRSLSNSSLFPRPCSPTTSDSGEEAVVNTSKEAAIAGRRMEKRQRNLTQAVSLSSLRTSTVTESNTEESSSHRSSPEALELQLPVDFDLHPAVEPLVSDMSHPNSLNETMNNRLRESSGVSRSRQASEEETMNFPESPSSLPPPPPFLLNPLQTFQLRNPNHRYGIFEP